MTLPSSIVEEVSEAKKLFPSVNVVTSTPSFLIATYERTPYTRIKMTLTFPDEYPQPSHPLVVNIEQSSAVPPGLKKKLEKELNGLASEKAEFGHYDEVRTVWERLISFVDTNLFMPCWKELRKSLDLVQSSNSSTKGTKSKVSTLSIISEPKGVLKLSLHNDAYSYTCKMTIDPAYPDFSGGSSCLLKVQSTNFPSQIEKMITSQGQEIVRRMQEGLTSERALHMSNPVKVPKNFHLNTEEFKASNKARLTNETIQNIKHDTEALKRASDLHKKEAGAVRAPGDNGYVDAKALAKERKEARRALQKLTEAERMADQKLEETERERMLEEKMKAEGYYELYDDGRHDPQPCLLVLITFLVDSVKTLVERRCPCCKERVLPTNPKELELMYGITSSDHGKGKDKHAAKEKRKMRPMRTYCGCWYHKSCLNTFLTEPPFGLECPTENCGRRVFHPDWPGDIKQLEREWAAKQARMREIEDAMLFL